MSQYKYFKLNSSLSYKQYSFNLSLLGDPKFAEKGVRGARRWPGGMGPAKSRGPTDRETRGQGSVPKQVQKPSRCMSFRECSLRCRRTACACVCSRLSLSGHREGGGRGDGVHNQRGGTLEPFFFLLRTHALFRSRALPGDNQRGGILSSLLFFFSFKPSSALFRSRALPSASATVCSTPPLGARTPRTLASLGRPASAALRVSRH